jgi:hypothetical protein
MQITSYDKHVRLLSSVALVVATPSLPLGRSRRRYGITKTEVCATLAPNRPGPALVGVGTVEEGSFVDGRWVEGRHLDHRVTVVDSDCTYCQAAVLVPGAYRNRGWRIHCLSCMRPTNTRNISFTASYPWPVLAS